VARRADFDDDFLAGAIRDIIRCPSRSRHQEHSRRSRQHRHTWQSSSDATNRMKNQEFLLQLIRNEMPAEGNFSINRHSVYIPSRN
jgi:phosphatidate phosphatase APP1